MNNKRPKKTSAPPTVITVAEFVRDGWQANIDNGICDVYRHHLLSGIWRLPTDLVLAVIPIDPPDPPCYLLSNEWGQHAVQAATKLDVVFRQPNSKPDTLPETLPPLFETQSTKR
jgi:hypothetical protein